MVKERVTLAEQIAELEHTLRWRQNNRSRWTSQETLSGALADRKILCMNCALETLRFVEKHNETIKQAVRKTA